MENEGEDAPSRRTNSGEPKPSTTTPPLTLKAQISLRFSTGLQANERRDAMADGNLTPYTLSYDDERRDWQLKRDGADRATRRFKTK